MASQTLTVGAASFGSTVFTWGTFPNDAGLVIDDALTVQSVPVYLRTLILSFSGTQSSFLTSLSDSVGGADQGQDLTSDWENYSNAITIEAGGLSIILPGPNNADNAIGDSGEWYGWHYSTAVKATLLTFANAYDALSDPEQDATTVTLDDGVGAENVYDGSTELDAIFDGATEITAMYDGATQIF